MCWQQPKSWTKSSKSQKQNERLCLTKHTFVASSLSFPFFSDEYERETSFPSNKRVENLDAFPQCWLDSIGCRGLSSTIGGEGSGSIYRIRMNEDTSTFLPYEHQEKPLDFFPKVYIYHTTVD